MLRKRMTDDVAHQLDRLLPGMNVGTRLQEYEGILVETAGSVVTVYNGTGGTLTKGTLVYVSSWNADNDCPQVAKADADALSTAARLVLTEDIADTATGEARGVAAVSGVDTAALAAGALVYLSSTAGGFTGTAPTGATKIQQPVGRVTVSHATTGEVYFFPEWGLFAMLPQAALQDGILSADAAGLAKMAAGFLQASADGRAKFADDFFTAAMFVAGAGGKFAAGCLDTTALLNVLPADAVTNALLLQAVLDGAFQADADTRALFADGIWTVAKLAEQTLTAGVGGATAKRFLDSGRDDADIDDTEVIGVAKNTALAAAALAIASFGFQAVQADCPLAAGQDVKVGVGGRATRHLTSQATLQGAISGEAAAFTQPGGATAVEILQALDVAGDRGRAIIVEGTVGGVADTEQILLDGTDTTTPVAGVKLFTRVSAVYMSDGLALGAQDVTVRAAGGGAVVCALVGGTSELGADIPSGSIEAYCNEVTITGPGADASFVTIVGIDAATDAAARERVQLDGAAGTSKVTTTTVWRVVDRICLGEFTNAAAGAVKTNETADTLRMRCGTVLVAAAARGDDAVVLVQPNVVKAETHTHQSAAQAGLLALAAVADVTAGAAELNALDGAPLGTPSFVIGAEAGNTINVAIQLKDGLGADLAVRGRVRAYLSDDANGDSLAAAAPTGGSSIGADGVLVPTPSSLGDKVLVHGNLAVDGGDATKFQTQQAACITINGVPVRKDATAAIVFSAAHQIATDGKWGIIAVQIDTAGNFSTKVPASPQSYADEATAIAALPAADAGTRVVGYITIQTKAGAGVEWDANTDDMTAASDCAAANFYDTTEQSLEAAKAFDLVSEADGDIDLNIVESGAKTFYLVLVLPNGKLAPSGAITFI